MWHALRAELAYHRAYLVGGLGVAAGISILISSLIMIDDDPPSFVLSFLPGMFMVMGPMVVAFIIQAGRAEERRTRLLLAGPLTPRQLAGVTVLMPLVTFGIGVAAAAVVLAAVAVFIGRPEREGLNIIAFVASQMFAYTQFGLLIQEATAAHRQQRRRPAAAGWTVFVAAVLIMAGLYVLLPLEILGWSHVILAQLVVAVTVMVTAVELYTGRNDFTR